ncbi:putative porin [Methylobacillus gramineus]|uniref:putative porin n=1 Tax=Methylobacillus gramineus TaxID=755169 RepID=UPI001CFFA913|nr:putative porin [Methylobacillus gramineus]MCB5186047.1 putative porin [Methylobacillus gramineus]
MNKTQGIITWLALWVAIITPLHAVAGERESLEQLRSTTVGLIEALVQEGILSKEKAEGLIRKAENARQTETGNEHALATGAALAGAANDGSVVRVQYVPEFVKQQLRADIEKDVMAKLNYHVEEERLKLPSWLDRISFEGDIRLRYEPVRFSERNASEASLGSDPSRQVMIPNSTQDQDRYRVRARFGVNAKISDWLSAGIRMTSGHMDNPLSPNQSIDIRAAKLDWGLDRVFITAKPYSWMTVSAGRFANPFFSSDMVWDRSLAFDGAAATFLPKFNDSLSGFGTIGAFPIDQVQKGALNKAEDKWILGAQAGIEWTSPNKSSAKLGLAFYDFKHVEGIANQMDGFDSRYNGTVMPYRQKGNNTFDINRSGSTVGTCGIRTTLDAYTNTGCGLASKFQVLNLTGQLDLAAFDPVHVILQGDYAVNIGFDQQEIFRRTNVLYEKENQAYQLKLIVGMPEMRERNDWQVFGAYKKLEADAVMDSFTDSDFHLGGTNAKGFILGGNYGIDKNTWLTARWLSTREITGMPLAIDVFQFDITTRF